MALPSHLSSLSSHPPLPPLAKFSNYPPPAQLTSYNLKILFPLDNMHENHVGPPPFCPTNENTTQTPNAKAFTW
jgi:hypothetical protein